MSVETAVLSLLVDGTTKGHRKIKEFAVEEAVAAAAPELLTVDPEEEAFFAVLFAAPGCFSWGSQGPKTNSSVFSVIF